MNNKIKSFIAFILIYFTVVFIANTCQSQPRAIGRIVTNLSVYSQPIRYIDTVKMEFVYFPDSLMVVMRVQEGKVLVQWLYPSKVFNKSSLPTDFLTKKGNPVKISEHNGWLSVSSIRFKSTNRITYKIEPIELSNGDIIHVPTRYTHDTIYEKDNKD